MMGTCMKILLSVSLLLIDLMGERSISLYRNEDIKERKATIKFTLHGELYGVRLIMKMFEKAI